ncbi:MAG: NAD(P)H-hydrate dehydratase [Thermoanaerobaculia bacterium]
MKILTAGQMRNIDRRAIETFGIPSIVLMENAALAVVDAIETHYPTAARVVIFCGPGQNGGDGFAVARHLSNRGRDPRIVIVGGRDAIAGDAKTNLEICEKMRIHIEQVDQTDALDQSLARATDADLAVDAIFGTGLNRPAEGVFAEAIHGLAALRLPIVAIDIPSGLNGSAPQVVEPAVQADLTVTFAQPKVAHIFEPAASYCGEVIVADISIPEAAVESENVSLSVVTPDDVAALFPARDADSHKGTYGHVALVSGSAGKSGAAILAARGALRTGSGLVTIVTDPKTSAIIDSVSIESMTLPVSPSELDTICGFVAKMDAALVGPGLPDDEDGYSFIRGLVDRVDIPLVLDATAVNAFKGDPAAINPRGRARVITPHPGELSRLIGRPASEINERRLEIAMETAKVSRCVVLLKGHQTIIAAPDGRTAVNPTGNPGMATGGMGDVLSGILVSLLGQGADLYAATCAAAYIHGFAGDLLRAESSEIGMLARDVADHVPAAIERIRGNRK